MNTGIAQLVLLAAWVAPACAGQPGGVPAAAVSAEAWSVDLEAAKAQAAREGKAVLVDITGSDWCRFCIQLRKEVFDKPEFIAYARDKFVLVEVDLPNRAIDKGLRARNEAICARYKVEAFPTVLALAPDGRVLGGFVGGGMEPDDVELALDAAYANLPKVAEAAKLTGEARARKLMEVYTSLDENLWPAADADKRDIQALDPAGGCGFAALEKAAEQRAAFSQEQQAAGADFRRRMETISRQLETALPANKPWLLALQSLHIAYAAETEQDVLAAKAKMLETADLTTTPAAASRLRKQAALRYGDPAAFLQKIKALRTSREHR